MWRSALRCLICRAMRSTSWLFYFLPFYCIPLFGLLRCRITYINCHFKTHFSFTRRCSGLKCYSGLSTPGLIYSADADAGVGDQTIAFVCPLSVWCVNNSMHIKFQLSNIQAKSLACYGQIAVCLVFGYAARSLAPDCFVNINLSLNWTTRAYKLLSFKMHW